MVGAQCGIAFSTSKAVAEGMYLWYISVVSQELDDYVRSESGEVDGEVN